MIDIKLVLAIVSTVLIVVGNIFYLKDLFAGKTKPHIYTWLIWSITQGTATAALIFSGGKFAGIGLTVATVLVFLVFLLSFKYGTKDITKSDTATLIVALLAIGVWIITKDPVISVFIVTAIDVIGYIPTIRKTYKDPSSESTIFWILFFISNILIIFASEEYNFSTMTYIVALVILDGIVAVLSLSGRNKNN